MKGSYPRNITIVSVVFIICILFLAAVNFYVGIQLRNEFVSQEHNTIKSVATLCSLFMQSSQDNAALFYQMKNVSRAFDFDHMIVTDTAGTRVFDSHVLKPRFLEQYSPVDFSIEFTRMPAHNELVRHGTTYLYRSGNPAFYLYLTHPTSFLSSYDTLFRWHLIYITVSLLFVGFLGIFLIRNLFLPMRYVTRLAQDLGVEMHKEDFVSKTFGEMFKKMKTREQTLVEFSAYIAHEFRNSIGTIAGLARLVEKGKKGASDIVRECNAMEQLISRLLEYSRPLTMEKQVFKVRALTEEALKRSRPPDNVTVEQHIEPDDLQVTGDYELLAMALANLFKNGYEAMKHKGNIICNACIENDHVVVAVTDTGPGMDSKTLDRIFTPFYTSKADGMGLGLAYVSRIVELHNGRITAESAPGEGTTFTITLPR